MYAIRSYYVLSVPAVYDEPKGLFLLEALASGVPVVQPKRGAFVEIVERTGGGLLVDADDPESLADGLDVITSYSIHYTKLYDLALCRTFDLPDWSEISIRRILPTLSGLMCS